MSKRIAFWLLAPCLVVCAPKLLLGQAASGPATRVPVTLVLVDSLPVAGAPFIVDRRPDLSPHDVLLLRPDVTPEQLSEAIRTLLVVRQAGGDTATTRAMLRIRPRQEPDRGRPREFPWVRRVIEDLRRAPETNIPGIGNVRNIEIWLPSQRGRARR